jgi:hypothetical protein
VVLALAVLGVYLLGAARSSVQGAAEAHGRAVYDLERLLHIDVEHALNDWLAHRDVLRSLANYEYATVYVIAAFTVLIWIYVARPERYRHARTSFLLVNLVGIATFAVYPVMPPRLITDLGFVDTVQLGQTWGSWGSPVVSHANDVAAMPSLHVAWSLWALVMLVRAVRMRLIWAVSAVQVLITTLVIMATGNHYLLDAVAGALLVALSVGFADFVHRGRPGELLSPADAFFVHVESPTAPQQVGGLVRLATTNASPSRDELERIIKASLDKVPRFRQRLVEPTRWRRARWVDHPDLDWAWHVPEYDVTGPDGRPGGEAAVRRLVAELASTSMPRDRPMWRFAFVKGVADTEAMAILIVHHAVADGFGTIAQALNFLEPPPQETVDQGRRERRPNPLQTAGAIAVGLAQLATDGRPAGPLPGGATAARRFGTFSAGLDDLRIVAKKHDVRITDVLLSAVAGAVRRVHPGPLPTNLRVAVPLMAREPGATAAGNLTAGVIVDVPLGEMPETARVARTGRHSGRLRTSTRALASHAVVRATGTLLPPVLHAWFARTVYGQRFFHAIVSNMPGPDRPMRLIGAPIDAAFPILPLAPGAPIVVGALGWERVVHVAAVTDPGLIDIAVAFAAAILDVIVELGERGPLTAPTERPTAPSRQAGSAAADEEVEVGRSSL